MFKGDVEKEKEKNTGAGQDKTNTSTDISESMEEIDKVVEKRFSDVLDDEIMQGLMLVTKRYLKEKLKG